MVLWISSDLIQKPRIEAGSTPDFFSARLGEMVNHEDPLVILSRKMPWDEIEAYLAPFLACQPKPGTVAEVDDLFGTHAQ